MILRLVIGSSADGRDRWSLCRGNTIVWAWSAPRILSRGCYRCFPS